MEFQTYFLSNKDIWFNPQKKYDKIIEKKYSSLLTEDNEYDVFTKILIYDQLPYYIYRNNPEIINKYHDISYILAKKLIETKEFYNYEPIKKCFIMLPLRHSNNISDNLTILNITKKLINTHSIFKRFYKATLLKLTLLNNKKYVLPSIINTTFNKSILDTNCKFTSLQNINLLQFKKYIKYFDKITHDNICVSISGGVDSILLLYYLKYLKKNIIAIHINYNNRKTSAIEMKNVILICNYLKIPIYIRTITELKRNEDNRNIYEDITRKLRFNYYNIVCKDKYVVALGHNKDDCIENIFSNIIKKKKYDNLFGMKNNSIENNVKIYRPFLNLDKKTIYHISNNLQLPYFYDSTPDWSERGKKRDILIPFLNKFDSRIIDGLYKLSQHMSSMYKIYNIFIKKCVTFNDNYLCKIDPIIFNYSIDILVSVLSYVCSSKNKPYFSYKSIKNLYQNYRLNKKIHMSNIYYFYNNIIYLK